MSATVHCVQFYTYKYLIQYYDHCTILRLFCIWFYFHVSGDMQHILTVLLTWLNKDFNKVHTNIIKILRRDMLGNHRGRGVGVGAIDPTISQPGTVRRWMVSTTPRLIYSQERSGTHRTGGWLSLGPSLGGTVKNKTGRNRRSALPFPIWRTLA